MDTTIKLKLIDESIEFLNNPAIFSGDINTIKAQFEFSESWNGLIKTAVFYRDIKKPYNVILSDDSCNVPQEVMQDEGRFYIGVFGVADDKVKTSEVVYYDIGKGVVTTGVVPEATQELWQQVMELCREAVDTAADIKDEHTQFSKQLEQMLKDLQTAISVAGQYEWQGTQIRFMQASGEWGEWQNIAGEFVAKSDLSSVTATVKQLFLLMHPVGSIFKTITDENPKNKFGGTWELVEKNNPVYVISDTKVFTVSNQDWVQFGSVEDVQNLFYTNYGFRPNISETGISFYNGDADATTRRVLGCDISGGGKYVNVTLTENHNGQIRINYSFTARDSTKTIYTWKRTV